MKTKILHVTQSTYGGVHKYLISYVKHADRDRYDLSFACPIDEHLWEELAHYDVKRHEIEFVREIRFLQDLRSCLKLYRLIKDGQYDVVHLHSSKAGFLGRIAAWLAHVPRIVYTPHGWSFHSFNSKAKNALYVALERLCSPLTSYTIAISNAEKESALRYRICPEDKIKVILNGVETDRFAAGIRDKTKLLSELGLPIDSIVVTMVGRLAEQKAPLLLIDIAEKVCSIYPSVVFLLVGDGPLRRQAQERIAAKQLENNVFITGWRSDIPDVLASSDIMVLTSLWEGFGLALAEAMCAGLPVVASRVDGIVDVVDHGNTGYLVEVNNVTEFAERIVQLASKLEIAREMGTRGRQRAFERFTIQRMAGEIEDLYEERTS